MKNKLLLIRADANKKIGMGHVMRCLTIAEVAKKAGVETKFFMADSWAEELLTERGQAYHILHTDFADMESELPKLQDTIEKLYDAVDEMYNAMPKNETALETVFLLDSYQITENYVQKLKKWLNQRNICLALMEDYGNIPYSADILINYNIYGVDFSYEKNAPQSLCGCKYMPLRQPFVQQKYEVREQVRQLLITTGGSDSYRIGSKLVKLLTEKWCVGGTITGDANFCIHVVCGKFSESRQELTELALRYQNVKVHTDVKEMWELMAQCDIAISAAGTTLYELCAVGVPTICFSFADNQILPGMAFEKHTPMYYAGDYEKDKKAMFRAILEKVEALCSMSKSEREKISRQLKEIVDGKGAERIVNGLFENRTK